jgi:hypothetical protein
MVTDYFVCYGASTEDLRKNVLIAIEKGWQPLGGVSVAVNIMWTRGEMRNIAEETTELYCQAVVKQA